MIKQLKKYSSNKFKVQFYKWFRNEKLPNSVGSVPVKRLPNKYLIISISIIFNLKTLIQYFIFTFVSTLLINWLEWFHLIDWS